MVYAVRKGKNTGIFNAWSDCEESVKGFKGAEFKKFNSEGEAKIWLSGGIVPSGYFYAIKYNENNTEIVNSWDECQLKVSGKSGVKYKKFKTMEEAKAFCEGRIYNDNDKRGVELKDLSIPVFYVDGSKVDDNIGFGVALNVNGKQSYFRGKTNGNSGNISGELAAVMFTLHLCSEFNYHEINVVHDYEGISAWVDGSWSAKSIDAKLYNEFVLKYLRDKNILVHFYRVRSHSGDELNNKVDKLAKEGAKNGVFIPFRALCEDSLDTKKCGIL